VARGAHPVDIIWDFRFLVLTFRLVCLLQGGAPLNPYQIDTYRLDSMCKLFLIIQRFYLTNQVGTGGALSNPFEWS